MSQYRLVSDHRTRLLPRRQDNGTMGGRYSGWKNLKVTINELPFHCLPPPQVSILVISILGLRQQPSVQGHWLKWTAPPLSSG